MKTMYKYTEHSKYIIHIYLYIFLKKDLGQLKKQNCERCFGIKNAIINYRNFYKLKHRKHKFSKGFTKTLEFIFNQQEIQIDDSTCLDP